MLLVMSAGRDGVAGLAPPRGLTVAGIASNWVRTVQLTLRNGGTLTQRVGDHGYVFRTTRLASGLKFSAGKRVEYKPLRTCQLCEAPNKPSPPVASGSH